MEDRSKRILDSACQKFEQYGIRSVSIDDICKDVRVSKKTFYQIYPKKEDLIEAVLEYTSDIAQKKFEEIQKNINAVDALVAIIKEVRKYSEETKNSFQYDLEKYYPEVYDAFQDKQKEKIFRSFEHNIRQGIAEGYYREDLDVELVSMFHALQIKNSFKEMRQSMPKIPLKRLNDFYIDIVVRLIANDKGLQYIEDHIREP